MHQDVSDIYEKLKEELTWLHGRWIMYRQLFAQSDHRVELLNVSAPAFFYVLQDMFLGDVLVSLSKLNDRAQTAGNQNLSLEQLQSQLENHGPTGLVQNCRTQLDEIHTACEPFKIWRNKQLAHFDLPTALQASTNPLPGISRQMIEEALALVRDYMNTIEAHYNNTEIGYGHFSMQGGDGEALVGLLKYGLRYETLVKSDEIEIDDWTKSEWKDA